MGLFYREFLYPFYFCSSSSVFESKRPKSSTRTILYVFFEKGDFPLLWSIFGSRRPYFLYSLPFIQVFSLATDKFHL